MSIEAMKQALAALHVHAAPHPTVFRAMDALRLAIEQAEKGDELVALHDKVDLLGDELSDMCRAARCDAAAMRQALEALEEAQTALRARLGEHPRQWQDLTEEEITEIARPYKEPLVFCWRDFARSIESKLKAKNG